MSSDTNICDQNVNAGANQALAVGSMNESLPHILNLNFDCFEKLFEWLSLEDLKSLRLTCKRMKKDADDYITSKYPLALRKINVFDESAYFCYLRPIQTESFGLIRNIVFRGMKLTLNQIEGIRSILKEVESIEIDCEFPKCDFYDVFLKYCTRLKHLMIESNRISIGNGNEWLNRQYPSLEHFGVLGIDAKCMKLKTFFEQNPNIRVLSANVNFIWQNRDWMLSSNIKIDRIDICSSTCIQLNVNIDLVFDLLNKLHVQEFYKRLHAYEEHEQKFFNKVNLLRALGGVHLPLMFISISNISQILSKLKELQMDSCPNSLNLEQLTNHLSNVRRVSIRSSSIDKIWPFIRRCPKLRQIRIQLLDGSVSSVNRIIDLFTLNKERKRLVRSPKITIFVQENVYLENKWKKKINLSSIELKRGLSWKPNNPFFEFNI